MSLATNLPPEFLDRMRQILGEEFGAFLNCYGEKPRQGLRVNTAKISVEEFLAITPFPLTPIPWVKNGFFYRDGDAVTKHPHYFAGLYYIQEPSAMVPASRLPVRPGERVLDLCAAPGGKATELGARLGGTGLLVANDVSASRARGLLKNLELFGIPNALVTAEEPRSLEREFPAYFDKILVDAPCSGEGMFRRDPALIKRWQERGPEAYAGLQYEIISCAARMIRPGGQLLYSTCTFSPLEDEAVVCRLLEQFPELSLEEAEGYEGFAPGLAGWGSMDVGKCIRVWPHRMEGEGHFAALLKKAGAPTEPVETVDSCAVCGRNSVRQRRQARMDRISGKSEDASLPQEAASFLQNVSLPALAEGVFFRSGEELFLVPREFRMPKLRYLRTGLHLGTIRKGRFEPSQALAMALTREGFPDRVELSSDDPRVQRYLKGETLEIGAHSGWVLVCCDGYPLGWGKGVDGTLRNKYHPGWRLR